MSTERTNRFAHLPGLSEAVEKYGISETARLLSLGLPDDQQIKAPSIYDWQRVPAERCLRLHQITGVPLHRMRPDVYPDPEKYPTVAPWPTQGEGCSRRSA